MRYLVLSGMLMMLAACGVNPPIEGRFDPYPPKQVYLASPDLQGRTAFGQVTMTRENGILHVVVPIRATSEKDLHIDAKWTFFNSEGKPIYTSQWEAQPVIVHNTVIYLQCNSTSGDAQDFQLALRYQE